MNVTTVKIQKSTKSDLDSFRSEHESYDSTIKKLVSMARQRNIKNELIEAYKQMGEADLELLEEWEPASEELAHEPH